MTVSELVKFLGKFPGELPVAFTNEATEPHDTDDEEVWFANDVNRAFVLVETGGKVYKGEEREYVVDCVLLTWKG